ncbi:MAG TPA: hypothetical protein VF384_06505 [Planctomycetota bacterium]
MQSYREEDELDRYVWTHFMGLFTDLEQRVWKVVQAEQKAESADETGGHAAARVLRSRWGRAAYPEVASALAAGWPAFRREARARVLRDHGADVFVNRCPRCHQVAETPRARQCRWCGCDWHRE